MLCASMSILSILTKLTVYLIKLNFKLLQLTLVMQSQNVIIMARFYKPKFYKPKKTIGKFFMSIALQGK